MNRESTGSVISDLLNDQRQAILGGRFDLVAIDGLEEELNDRARAGNLALNELEAIREQARRNAGLLSAALAGVRDARHRVEALVNPNRSLTTYDEGGRATCLDRRRGDIEKKA